MRARLADPVALRASFGKVARGGIVVMSSLVVAYGLVSSRHVTRIGGLGLLGGLGGAVVAPWVVLFGAVLSIRSVHLPNLAGPVTVGDALLLLYVLRRGWVLLIERRFAGTKANVWLLLFLAWAWFCTLSGGVKVTPLERITLYVFVCLVLSCDRVPHKKVVFGFFLAYASIEVLLSLPSQAGTRLFGVNIGDPQQLSILCFAGLAPVLSGRWEFRGRKLLRAFLVIGILLARTRGAIVAMAVALFLQHMRRLSRRRLIVTIAGLIVGAALLYSPATSAFHLNENSKDIRTETISRGIKAGFAAPIFGHGWGANLAPPADDGTSATTNTVADQEPYDLFVSVFAFVGLPGLILLLLFLGQALRTMVDFDRAAFLFCAAFLTLSFTEMTIYSQSLGTIIFFIYCGMGQRFVAPGDRSAALRPRPLARARR